MSPFFSRVPTHYSFTFNLWFLYELMHKVHLSETVKEYSHFRFHFFFQKSLFFIFYFLFCFVLFLVSFSFCFFRFLLLVNKMHGLFDFKTANLLSKLIKKPQAYLLLDLFFLGCGKKFTIHWYQHELELPKTDLVIEVLRTSVFWLTFNSNFI